MLSEDAAEADKTGQTQSKKHPQSVLNLDVDRRPCFLPHDAPLHFDEGDRKHKGEIVMPERLRAAPTTFPRCPNCASFYLYRRNNIGNYAVVWRGSRQSSPEPDPHELANDLSALSDSWNVPVK